MPRGIKYKYVTTNGLPPLDGLPPKLALELEQGLGQGHGHGARAAGIIGNGNGSSRSHQCGCHTPPPYCPVDPPPPYMPVSPQQQQQAGPPPVTTRTTSTADTGCDRGGIPDRSTTNMGMNHYHRYYCYSYMSQNEANANTNTIPFHSHSHSCSHSHTCPDPPPYSHYYPMCYPIIQPSSFSSIHNSPTQQGCCCCPSYQSQQELPSPPSSPASSQQIPTRERNNSPTAPTEVPLPLPIGSIIPGTREIPLVIPSSSSPSSSPSSSGTKPEMATGIGVGFGFGYIFPEHHTTIHLIEPEYAPFNHHHHDHHHQQQHPSRPSPPSFRFSVYKVSTSPTIAEFMKRVCFCFCRNKNHDLNLDGYLVASSSVSHDDGNDDWVGDGVYAYGIIETLPLSDGQWGRGQEFWIGDDSMAAMRKLVHSLTLADVGWDKTRGTKRAGPVWIATTVVWE
ncbi:hypothetical protein VTN77DRAFT_3068 [Rasamsonia byssochlamydoides]|uniref:uncharacterized protein n=1 Tax=Rasamsonia byssochlamydoides TaxID=89139 RepID=UPI0037437081